MQLFINSPSYYSQKHGVDDEIYWFCRELCKFVSSGNYSDFLDSIAVTPIVVPKEESGDYKEIKQTRNKGKIINIFKHIEYEIYVQADIEEKKKLIFNCVLLSIKSVKSKGKIDYIRLESDLLEKYWDLNVKQ